MTRQLAICTACGTSFSRNPVEPWKNLCLACWRTSKARAGNQADRLHIQLDRALTEAATLRRQVARLEARAGIPPEVLARLIRLCHPDRHQGSEAATKATQWLLSRRKEASR